MTSLFNYGRPIGTKKSEPSYSKAIIEQRQEQQNPLCIVKGCNAPGEVYCQILENVFPYCKKHAKEFKTFFTEETEEE